MTKLIGARSLRVVFGFVVAALWFVPAAAHDTSYHKPNAPGIYLNPPVKARVPNPHAERYDGYRYEDHRWNYPSYLYGREENSEYGEGHHRHHHHRYGRDW